MVLMCKVGILERGREEREKVSVGANNRGHKQIRFHHLLCVSARSLLLTLRRITEMKNRPGFASGNAGEMTGKVPHHARPHAR